MRSWSSRTGGGERRGDTMCGESDWNNRSGGRGRTWDVRPHPGSSSLGFSVPRMRNPRQGVSGQEELLGFGMCVCVCARALARLLCVSVPLFDFLTLLRRLKQTPATLAVGPLVEIAFR